MVWLGNLLLNCEMGMFKKIGSIVVNVGIVVFLVIAGFLALSTVSVFDLRSFVVQSGSMEPVVHTGSVILVRKVSEYGVGDIVTHKTSSKDVTITHRIVREETRDGQKGFVFKGDANTVEDEELVPESDIVGKILFQIPYLGYVVDYVKKPVGFILFIVIPAVIIVYEELRKMIEEIGRLWSRRKKKVVQPLKLVQERPISTIKPDRPVVLDSTRRPRRKIIW